MGKTNLIVEPGKQDFVVKRVFDAPPALVYKAYTDPELLRQWLGPRKYAMTDVQLDIRSGGSWRYVHRDDEGNAFGFRGVYHDVQPERIVQTFEFDGYPGHVSLETASFEEQGGKTLVRTHAVYQSVEDRDGMIQSGMEEGMNEGYDRLDELLSELQTSKATAR